MPASDFEDFRALDVIEPFGPIRDNWHAAQIAYILAQAHGNPRRARPKFADFMYKDPYEREAEQVKAADGFFFAETKGQ